ncbi:coiled-coil domain-containing protein 107 isoform X2 [Rana temporaria]|uniref:coiled-coil domain-containing protein 107 isoform X2 n=1 Tax=Rana temporaria TaxID=8407 RepID=UPI001AAC6064|nr:coiled-coil domain-containing protein 107 isoform X2 [Rana temporaria]
MVLTSSQHILLAVSLALCMCFLVPRMIGGPGEAGKKDPRRMATPFRGHSAGSEKGSSNMDHIKSAMEQEMKSARTGESRSVAFALMPLYAVGVAVFAAYKFTKIKSNENSKSKSVEEEDKKTKQTESQLVELERHLSQTEQMLNSILTQLDPLTNCVSTLAVDQKSEIMNQLQSIRRLMKKSGIDKAAPQNSANQTCENTLENLIHSFATQPSEVHENYAESKSEESLLNTLDTDISAHNPVTEESSLNDLSEGEDEDDATSPVSEGLRKRNV